MELKKSNNIFNIEKTDKDFLEQINEYKKQAIDIQKHNNTIIETINGQQRTLGNVPKRRPTAIETFIEKHIADIKKCDDEIANVLTSQRSRGYSSVRGCYQRVFQDGKAYITIFECGAVSYTHLDVYKRQQVGCK